MSRYIDADSFIDYLGLEDTEEAREENYGEIVTLSDFDNQPTADVEKVKHGQWLDVEDKNGNQVKICSHCAREGCYKSTYEESFDYDYNENCYCDGYDEHREYISTKYCSWCGAKMDL